MQGFECTKAAVLSHRSGCLLRTVRDALARPGKTYIDFLVSSVACLPRMKTKRY